MTASKRILCLSLCLVWFFAFTLTAKAQETTALLSSEDFAYEVLEDGTLCLTEYLGEDTDVLIPSEIDEKTVSVLGDELFWYREELTSVTLPESLEHIGARVFQSCTSLNKIVLPDTVMEIGDACFLDCTGLTEVNIPSNLSYVGAFAFDNTPWLTQFDGCSSIIFGGKVFYKYLDDEDSVVIPKDVLGISGNAFENKSLGFVEIPDSVAFIGDYCFYNCTNLKEVKLPSEIYYLGENSLGALQGNGELAFTENFVIYADEDTLGAEYARQYGVTLLPTSEFTAPESLPEEEKCVPTGEIKAAAETQKSAGLSQGALITIVLSLVGCVVIIGAVTLISYFYEKKRKRLNKNFAKKKK